MFPSVHALNAEATGAAVVSEIVHKWRSAVWDLGLNEGAYGNRYTVGQHKIASYYLWGRVLTVCAFDLGSNQSLNRLSWFAFVV